MSAKIGFIGVGNMGKAILSGIIKSDISQYDDIYLFNRHPEKLDELKAAGCHVAPSAHALCEASDYIFLAVKPQNYEEILSCINDPAFINKVFITIAAGISIEYIQKALGFEAKVVRAMPNTPLTLGLGATAVSYKAPVTKEEFDFVDSMFASAGSSVLIDESAMNEIIAVNGSSPAYFYYIVEIISRFAESRGIDYNEAIKLTAETMIGSANMILKSGKTPDELVKQVTSPGGTTLEAMKVFYDRDLNGLFCEAMDKCVKRAYELGR